MVVAVTPGVSLEDADAGLTALTHDDRDDQRPSANKIARCHDELPPDLPDHDMASDHTPRTSDPAEPWARAAVPSSLLCALWHTSP